MVNNGLFFITNHENAPVISAELVEAYPAIVSRELSDLVVEPQTDFQFFSTEYIKSPFSERSGTARYSDIEAAMSATLGNAHTFYILERLRYFNGTPKTDMFRSCFNYLPYLQESLLRAADIVQQANADYVVFSSTPHDLEAWLVFLYAHQRGLRTYAICQSELPWRVFAKEICPDPVFGCKPLGRFPGADCEEAQPLSDEGKNYIALKRGDYVTAEPKYMKAQKVGDKRTLGQKLSRLLTRLFSGRVEKHRESASNMDRELSKLLNKFRSIRLRKALDRYVSKQLPNGKFIAVFLHFQPERTSVPEGGRYAPQINAIAALRGLLPEDWGVVVKEHPSMFMLKSKRPFRHPDFYRVLAGMPGTKIVDETFPSFTLIDASKGVVTLTGTVGFEALCRGRPVISMGDAAYRNYPGVVDLYDRDVSEVNLVSELERALVQLADPLGIEASAARTEAQTFSDSRESEHVSRGTMANCLSALAESLKN